MARLAFRNAVAMHLTSEEIDEISSKGQLSSGSVGSGWEEITGFIPDERHFYEIEIYKPSNDRPYIEKSYVRMLSPRDRATDVVYFMWRPRRQSRHPRAGDTAGTARDTQT